MAAAATLVAVEQQYIPSRAARDSVFRFILRGSRFHSAYDFLVPSARIHVAERHVQQDRCARYATLACSYGTILGLG
jgi:hypothetical protein